MYRMNAFGLENQLRGDEKLLWEGRPKREIIFTSKDAYVIPFILLWFGFAIFWEGTAIAMGAPLFMKLWGILFVLVSIYIVIGRFFIEAWQRNRTFYGVTNERIIIAVGGANKKTTSINLNNLPEITLKENKNGTGTVIFGGSDPREYFLRGQGTWKLFQLDTSRFESINNAREVYDIIRQAQRQASGRG